MKKNAHYFIFRRMLFPLFDAYASPKMIRTRYALWLCVASDSLDSSFVQ